MSKTEHKKGKLKPTGKSVEQYMADVKIPDYYSSEIDYFNDEMYDKAVCIDGIVYEIECEDVDVFGNIAEADVNADGTIDFEVKFYNGGACMSEMINKALVGVGMEVNY